MQAPHQQIENARLRTAYAHSPEFQLMLAYLAGRRAEIETLLRENIHWERFQALCDYHRTGPIIAHILQEVGSELRPPVFEHLRSQVFGITARNLKQQGELFSLLDILEPANIQAVPFKGIALSQALYGSIGVRPSSDIDLFLRRSDVESAMDRLADHGYKSAENISHAQMKHQSTIDFEHSMANGGVLVDLHWGIVPEWMGHIDTEKMWRRLDTTRLGSREILSFRPEDLVLLLSLHAAKHFCDKLVWPLDIVELIRGATDFDWDGICASAVHASAEQYFLLTLAVCGDFFGLEIPDRIIQLIEREVVINAVLPEIHASVENMSSLEYGPRLRHWSLQFARGWQGRLRYIRTIMLSTTVADLQAVDLPGALAFLYPVVRLGRHAGRALGLRRSVSTDD